MIHETETSKIAKMRAVWKFSFQSSKLQPFAN